MKGEPILSATRRNLKIVRLMLSEERRMHSSMIGKVQFLMFPVLILAMSFVLALSSKQLLRTMPMTQVYVLLHSILLIYGLGVGGFALFGERIAQKRFGDVTMLLETPTIQPIDFRSMFLNFYVKDIIYYIVYSIIPLATGIGLTIPITGFKLTSVVFLLLTMTLTFLLGISLSFFLSSMYVRSRAVFGGIVAAILGLILYGFLSGSYQFTDFIPTFVFQNTGNPIYALVAAVLILAFSFVAVTTVKVKFGKATEKFHEEMIPTAGRFTFARGLSTFMAKDWIDLIRSKTLMPVVGAYVGPLAFLAVLFWFLGNVLLLPLHFNLIFYAGMIGFFGVSIYGWLNLLDTTLFYEVLPVKVTQIVRTKLLLFIILAVGMSTAFLIALGILQSEWQMLWLSLIVAYSTTSYTVTSTAYLTGLRTNSYLFDPKTLGKFSAIVIPPLIAVTILSLNLSNEAFISTALLLLISAALASTTIVVYRRIGKKWDRESFEF